MTKEKRGYILTGFAAAARNHSERLAMQRPGTPDELPGIAVMPASDAPSHISGSLIRADGGCLAGSAPWLYTAQY